jgi:hypothetical protein
VLGVTCQYGRNIFRYSPEEFAHCSCRWAMTHSTLIYINIHMLYMLIQTNICGNR